MKTIFLTIILGTVLCATTYAGGLRQNRSINEIYNDLITRVEITHAESTANAVAVNNEILPLNIADLPLDSERNIEDFPYNTEVIASGYRAKLLVEGMNLTDETEVSDFPYNTEVIANGYKAKHMIADSELSPEAEVKDFPYNTEVIAKGAQGMELLMTVQMDEEQYVEDIPFDTAKIAAQVINAAE